MACLNWLMAGTVAILLLAACGFDDDEPSQGLPASVSLQVPALGEPGLSLAMRSSVGGSSIDLGFQWNFGDGNASTVPEPSHAYSAPGRYRVSLRITDSAGDSRSAQAEVLIRRASYVEQAVCVRPDRTGWCRQSPEEGLSAIVALSYVGNASAWGSAGDGRIYFTDPTSSSWQARALDSRSRRILHIGFDAGQVVGWALGVASDEFGTSSRGVLLLKTSDGGRTWNRQPLPAGWDIAKVENGWLKVLDSTHVILGHQRQSLVSADGGITWASAETDNRNYGRTGTTLWSTVASTPTSAARLRRSTDLGRSFVTVLTLGAGDSITQVHFLDDLRGWVAFTQFAPEPGRTRVAYMLLSTVDGGATWQAPGGVGFQLGNPLDLITYEGCGGPRYQFIDMAQGMAQVHCYTRITDARELVWRTVDGGRTWHGPLSTGDFCVEELQVEPAGHAWTTGRCTERVPTPPNRKAYLTRDLGLTWKTLEAAEEAPTSPVLSVSLTPDGAILLRYAAKTYRSVDQGATWQAFKTWPAAPAAPSFRHAVRFTSTGQGYAVGTGGQLMVTRDGGRQWQAHGLVIRVETGDQPTGRIEFLTPETGWILGYDRLYRTIDGGLQWDEVPATDFTDFSLLEPLRLWGAARVLGPFSSIDGGLSWRQPAGASGLGFRPLGIRFADAQRGVTVGEGGGVAYTHDAGESWQRAESGTTSTLRRVHFSDATTAWAVGAEGAVQVSRDAGAHWQPIAIDQIFGWNSVFFVDALRGWIVGNYGSIASTRDGGQTWTLQDSGTGEHLYDVFGVDAETLWVVGERGSLYATVTGGD